jgi:hypothetical protein
MNFGHGRNASRLQTRASEILEQAGKIDFLHAFKLGKILNPTSLGNSVQPIQPNKKLVQVATYGLTHFDKAGYS